MIELPTKRRLERRRDRLYNHLLSVIHHATIIEVEDIMRKIHIINHKLYTCFRGGIEHETKELFIEQEENDITAQDTSPGEVLPTAEELAKIESSISKGEI
jgi:hypothetical protein